MKKFCLLLTFIALIKISGYSQGISINTTGATADISAMLDIDAVSKGLLIPRIALTDTSDVTTIATPATSLIIYNTSTTGGLVEGYYYNAGTSVAPHWVQLVPNPMTQNLNLAGNKIINLATCTNDNDAANKAYVDAVAGGGGGGGTAFNLSMLSSVSPGTMNFGNAVRYCYNLNESVNGTPYSDWHLPTFIELIDLISHGGCYVPDSSSTSIFWTGDFDFTQRLNYYGSYSIAYRMSDGQAISTSSGTLYYVRCAR